MSEKTHAATQPKPNQQPADILWRAHTYLCGGVDVFETRLVSDRFAQVDCKRCRARIEKFPPPHPWL